MEIIFTESTALYFYSALLQANAAMIALIGLYTTFRLQSAYSNIDSAKSYFFASNETIRNFGLEFEEKSYAEKEKYIKNNPATNITNKRLHWWFRNLQLIKELKRGVILPTILLGIALISDSVFYS